MAKAKPKKNIRGRLLALPKYKNHKRFIEWLEEQKKAGRKAHAAKKKPAKDKK